MFRGKIVSHVSLRPRGFGELGEKGYLYIGSWWSTSNYFRGASSFASGGGGLTPHPPLIYCLSMTGTGTEFHFLKLIQGMRYHLHFFSLSRGPTI